MNIRNISDLRRAYRHGPFAWPGGYPLAFLMDDGQCVCHDCAQENRHSIVVDTAWKINSGWRAVALINCADSDETTHCASCDTVIHTYDD